MTPEALLDWLLSDERRRLVDGVIGSLREAKESRSSRISLGLRSFHGLRSFLGGSRLDLELAVGMFLDLALHGDLGALVHSNCRNALRHLPRRMLLISPGDGKDHRERFRHLLELVDEVEKLRGVGFMNLSAFSRFLDSAVFFSNPNWRGKDQRSSVGGFGERLLRRVLELSFQGWRSNLRRLSVDAGEQKLTWVFYPDPSLPVAHWLEGLPAVLPLEEGHPLLRACERVEAALQAEVLRR